MKAFLNGKILHLVSESDNESDILHRIWKIGILSSRGEVKDNKVVSVELEVE